MAGDEAEAVGQEAHPITADVTARWAQRAVSLALVLAFVLPACGTRGDGRECTAAGTAEVCLSRGSTPQLTATGLEPGSQIIVAETKGDGSPPPQIPPATAGPDGTFPSDGGALRFSGGTDPLTILVTVTPRSGKPTTVTFQRK